MKKMKHLLKNQKGLTLVELLAVIVILAIVSAIAVPAIGGIIDNSRYSAVKADATSVLNAAKMYFIDNPDGEGETQTVSVEILMKKNFLESAGKISKDATVKKGSPNTLTTETIKYSGDKTIKFNGATLDQINTDEQKGSDTGNKVVPKNPTTTP